MEIGEPLAEPGLKFKYCDINYVLLTEIMEGITKEPFYQSISRLIGFKELGLTNTWFASLERKDQSDFLVHQYWSEKEWDSHAINPSWDLYGGGGLAASVGDLARFFQYLFEGKIIQDKKLLKLMHSYVLPKDESKYCLGLMRIPFSGDEAYYHGGFWGTDAMYLPKLNASFSAIVLEKDERDVKKIVNERIVAILKSKVSKN